MITSATQEQWDRIEELKNSIINSMTNQPTDKEIRDCVTIMWKRMGKTPREILIADCPISAAKLLKKKYKKGENPELDKQVYVSIWWRAWSGWYEGAKILGVEFDEEKFNLLLRWSKAIPVIFANEFYPAVSRPPIEIHWNNQLLHNESGMSVKFKSGWGIYTINGIPVDEQIVMKPKTQTLQQLEKEENADKKAIRIDRFGWVRYIKESGAKEVHSRKNEVEGTLEVLYKLKDGSQRLVATCPTKRIFAMGVPSEVKTCEEAQTWLGGDTKVNVIGRT